MLRRVKDAPAQTNAATPCLEPPPMVRWEDYQGPLHKTVAAFTRKLERRTVHPTHYKPGTVLCSLELGDKFLLFAQDAVDPVVFSLRWIQRGSGSGVKPGCQFWTGRRRIWPAFRRQLAQPNFL